MFRRQKKERASRLIPGCLLILLISAVFLIAAAFFMREKVQESAETLPASGESLGVSTVGLFADLLGFRGSRTYLLLFQNNTELRPSGGFIGSYAVVRMDKMRPEVVIVSGTETLDAGADPSKLPEPPQAIREYLGVEKWYFRDSNWSPDFAESAATALDRYRAEGGAAADDIDIVIAVTPTVIERILERTGPVVADGLLFSHDTITEKLEYEVEYGYADRGISFADRKRILGPLMAEIISRVRGDVLLHLSDYAALFERLVRERHILLFSEDDSLMRSFDAVGATGHLVTPKGDYLMWVDANLGALKTDHALERALRYDVAGSLGAPTATATMRYDHRGGFDWRTTRYRTYARVFVPLGAELIGAYIDGKPVDSGNVQTGSELGKQWFGTFVSIEPGTQKTLSFSYRLPALPEPYTLFVQKQAGTIAHGLTVSADFGTDKKLYEETDLRVDRIFEVKF
jgi:hypothetical protein